MAAEQLRSLSLENPSVLEKTTSEKKLALMLIVCGIMVFGMVILGGLTRLTGSGLSIVEWKPISGILPPLTSAEWQALFERYQTSPEFQKVNSWMTLGDFKPIFWLEYIHRLGGRLVGLFFLIPIAYSAWHTALRSWCLPLIFIWMLGGCQAILGWYMVKSGLIHDPWVSPYRLTAHLLLAVLILGALELAALRLLLCPCDRVKSPLRSPLLFLLVCIVSTIIMGGFVAGHHAGLIHNTFPDMSGELIPGELWKLSPGWRNFLDNPTGVQFLHRLLALATVCAGAILLIRAWRYPSRFIRRLAVFTFSSIIIQAALGIATLLWVVPLTLALLHQVWAMVLFLLTLGFYFSLQRMPGERQKMEQASECAELQKPPSVQ